MPYNFPSKIPSVAKSLPIGAQKIFIISFNENEKLGEEKANEAAWSSVKETYEQKDDKWIKIKETSEEEREEKVSFVFSLSEAKFDEKEKTADVTIIKEGWSLNSTNGKRRYYSIKAVSDVVEQLDVSRKMFFNHAKDPNRDVGDWTATIKEAWLDENEAKAKIDFTNNPKTVWLFEEALKHPEEVQLSIDGNGSIRFGKVGDTDAAIIEGVKKLYSVDFVTIGAAGGKVDRVAASTEIDVLNEALKTLDDIIADTEKIEQPYVDYDIVMGSLRILLWDLIYSSDVGKEDVATNLKKALNTFSSKMVEIIGKIKDNNKNSGFYENLEKKREYKMKLSELKEKDSEAYESLVEQANLIAVNQAEKQVKEQLETAKKEKADLEAKIAEGATSLETANKELVEAKTKLDVYEQKEKEVLKKESIANKIKENKLEGKVGDEFVKMLEKLEDEVIDEVIAERVKAQGDKLIKDNAKPKSDSSIKEKSVEERKALLKD